MSKTQKISVFYDGSCPLCTREIGFYKRQDGAKDIKWVDVSAHQSGDCEIAPGLSHQNSLARFHVLKEDDNLVSGALAFIALWENLPRFRPMAKIAHLPAMPWLLEIAYLIFLKIRPKLQKMVSIQSSKRGAPLPNWLRRELRSDHAGESGAVAIYQGILFVSRTRTVRDFALKHLKTEKRHLGLIEEVLPAKDKSLLTPLWRVAGFLTGAAPALFGFKAVCLTIDAVETFVVGHYTNQIERLSCSGDYPELLDLLKVCRDDEARHRDDARSRHNKSQGAISRAWCGAVRHGSFFAVFIAKRF